MDRIVRAFPILEGQEEVTRAFARALQTERTAEAADFYQRFGVVRETWHLQETPNGLWLIGVTEFLHREAEEAAAEYSRSAVSFDQWFKSQVRRISGIDPDTQPLGPPTECIFDTREI